MGNTGNSETYPYGIQYKPAVAGDPARDQVYNRTTGEVVEEFEPFGVAATQKLNQLVSEFNNSSAVEKAAIVAPKVSAERAVA